MIKQIALLSLLSIGVLHADDAIQFVDIPDNVTTEEAIGAVANIADRIGWTVLRSVDVDNKLRLKLDRRGYRSVLTFTFTKNKITYSDSTTTLTEIDDEYDERNGSVVSVPSKAPASWIKNLKRYARKDFKSVSKSGRVISRPAFKNDILVYKKMIPEHVKYSIIGDYFIKSKWYGGMQKVINSAVNEAASKGANGILIEQNGFRPSGFSWVAPYVKGKLLWIDNYDISNNHKLSGNSKLTVVERLEKLKGLLDSKIITENEYNKQRGIIISDI